MTTKKPPRGGQVNPDLTPHKPAVVAMFLYGSEYSRQNLGSMGFWKQLPEPRKRVCRDLVEKVKGAREER